MLTQKNLVRSPPVLFVEYALRSDDLRSVCTAAHYVGHYCNEDMFLDVERTGVEGDLFFEWSFERGAGGLVEAE